MSKTVKFYLLEINAENQKVVIPQIFVLRFPKKLHEYLSSKLRDNKNLYIKPLSQALRSKFTDIITTDDRINFNTLDNPWIYAFSEINLEVLKVIIKEWLDDQMNSNKDEENNGIPIICFDELRWNVQDIEIDFRVNEMGTSDPYPSSIAYNFLMSYISHKLSGNLEVKSIGKRIDGKNTESTFKFYHVSTSERGAELISWPFQEKSGYYWTYKIKLTLQTIPFSPKPYLNINVELLRFCKTKIRPRKTNYRYKAFSAYVKLPANKIKGHNEEVFIKVQLKQSQDNNKMWKWESGFLKAMEGLLCKDLFPIPSELIETPTDFLSKNNGVSIAIPLGTHLYNRTNIGGGPSFYDKAAIINEAKKIISTINDPIMNLVGDFVIREPLKYKISELKDQLKFRLAKFPDKIEAYYYTDAWLTKCLNAFEEVFKDYKVEHIGYEYIIKGMEEQNSRKIVIEPINMKEWETADSNFFNIQPNRAAYELFEKNLRAKVRKSPEIVGALFELEHETIVENETKSAFEKLIDPKLTIRRIMAEKNRLTQFITPPIQLSPSEDEELDEENNKNKHQFISGIKDLMRQVGIINKRISDINLHQNKAVLHIGLWFYKSGKRKFPILVAIFRNEPYITFYKEEENGVIWEKYSGGQIKLAISAGEKIELNKNYNTVYLKGFIIRAIENIRSKTGVEDVILYVHAQNCRSFLQWFTNGLFGGPDASLTITNINNSEDVEEKKYNNIIKGQSFNGFQIVRLRNKQSYETPGWTWIKNDNGEDIEEPNSHGTGIFRINEKTYYSIQKRPDSFRLGQNDVRSTKADSVRSEFKKLGVLEISIPTLKGELNELELAKITHFLRLDTSFQYKDQATEFPLPIHLAKTACEYADAYYKRVRFNSKDGSIKDSDYNDEFGNDDVETVEDVELEEVI